MIFIDFYLYFAALSSLWVGVGIADVKLSLSSLKFILHVLFFGYVLCIEECSHHCYHVQKIQCQSKTFRMQWYPH